MKLLKDILKGINKGAPIGIGYIPIGISFGLIAKSFDIPGEIVVLMSLIVYAGASQFIAVSLIHEGVTVIEIVITTFIVNLRHFLMTASLSEKIKNKYNKFWLALIAFGVTDETFALISMTEKEKLNKGLILGINLIAYISWSGSTFLGLILSSSLPEAIRNGMGISLYAMFIALLIPNIKTNKTLMKITVISLLFSSLLFYIPFLGNNISSGFRIIIVIIISSLIGAYMFEEEVDNIE